MKVRFGAVAGVPTATQYLAYLHVLPGPHRDAPLFEMTERNDDTTALDQDMVPRQRHPAFFARFFWVSAYRIEGIPR